MSRATTAEEFGNAKVIESPKYKTSMLYGKKLMILPNDVFELVEKYIRFLRPKIVNDEDGVFLSARNVYFESV